MSAQAQADWKTRFKAWWEGYDLAEVEADKSRRLRERNSERNESQAAAPRALWSPERIQVVEAVWGEGFISPGGEEYIPTLIKPFGLDEKNSVVELNAGLGGITRHMAEATGAWVTGLEDEDVLVKAGMERSIRRQLDKRAPILQYDSENFDFEKRYDAIFAKEAFFRIRDKDKLFHSINAGLKSRGQLLFTDYVLAHSSSTSAPITAWRKGEPGGVWPSTIVEASAQLDRLAMDVRISEDVTDAHRDLVLEAWSRMTGAPPPAIRDNPRLHELWIAEAELWMRRVAALDTGDLRVYRFFALAAGDAPQ